MSVLVVQSACVAPVVALTAANIGTTTPTPRGGRFGAAGLAQRVIKPPDRWDDGTGRRDLRLVWSSTERWQKIPSMTTELLSAAEAARILGVPRSRVVDLADTDPAFPAFQPSSVGGRAWPRAAVEAWAAAHPDRGPLHRGPTLPEVGGRSPQVWTVAVPDEVRWALRHASPTVRDVLRRLPPPAPPRRHARGADQRHAHQAHRGG